MNYDNSNFIYRHRCPACNSPSQLQLFTTTYDSPSVWQFIESYYSNKVPLEYFKGQPFCVSKCNECGLIYQNLVLSDKLAFDLYENWIDKTSSLKKKLEAPMSTYMQYSKEIESLSSLFPSKRPSELYVAEFGMGWGFWSRMASAYGLNVKGVELSTTRKSYAQKFGIHVVNDINDIEHESLDFIYSNQVFEHLSLPLECLKSLSNAVKTGGYIYIQVPNNRGVEKRFMQKNWLARKDAIHPMEHINAFDARSLKLMGQKCGLSVHKYQYIGVREGFVRNVKEKTKSALLSVLGGTQIIFKKH